MTKKPIIIGLWILMLAIFVYAATPTTPSTISPITNSLWLDDPNLSCSGSTGAVGDTYYEIYSQGKTTAYRTSLSVAWLQSGPGNYHEGSSASDRYYLSGTTGDTKNVSTNFTFNGDIFEIDVEVQDGIYAAVITINGTTVFSNSSTVTTFGPQTLSIDTSRWNDGNNYTMMFYHDGNDPSNKHFYWWWDEVNTERETDVYLISNNTEGQGDWDLNVSGTYTWNCRACDDDDGSCSAYTTSRNLILFNLTNCTSGNTALNFTLKDEESGDRFGPLGFQADLTLSSAWDSKAFNFDLQNFNNYSLCLNPAGYDITLDGFIDYSSTNSSYSYPRQYYFEDATINGNAGTDIDLYLLDDTYSSPITFTALEDGGVVSGLIIHIQRYSPGDGTYTLVAMGETGPSGTEIIYLRQTDAWYRIIAIQDGVQVYITDPLHILEDDYEINLGSGGAEAPIFDAWDALGSIAWSIGWNNVTNVTTLTADDASGVSTSMCFKVDKYSLAEGTQTICYTCESSSSVTIPCTITDADAYYEAKFIAYKDSVWRLVGTRTLDLAQDLANLIGKDGLLYSFLFIGMIAFSAVWNPAVAVSFAIAGLAFASWIGFIQLSIAAIVALIFVGGVIAIKSRN